MTLLGVPVLMNAVYPALLHDYTPGARLVVCRSSMEARKKNSV